MMQANCTVSSIVLTNYESYDTPANLITSAHCIVVPAIRLETVIPKSSRRQRTEYVVIRRYARVQP